MPVCPCKGSGKETQSSNTASPRNIRILGVIILFLAPVSFRGLSACPCKEPGTAARSSNAEFPGNIRILAGFMLFLDSVIFREIPRASGLSM